MTRAEYRQALRGRRGFVGMDLSSTKDLTALVAVFPDDDDSFDVLAQFFCPKENIRQRSLRDKVPYDEFERTGDLIATPGARVDYEAVRQTLKDWDAEFDIKTIAYDPWNATDLTNRLKELDEFDLVEIRQGFASLSAPTKYLEMAILSKKLRHDGHPVLRWCVGNVAISIDDKKSMDDAANIKPSKIKSNEKIDGVVALVMAVDQMNRNNSSRDVSADEAVMIV